MGRHKVMSSTSATTFQQNKQKDTKGNLKNKLTRRSGRLRIQLQHCSTYNKIAYNTVTLRD